MSTQPPVAPIFLHIPLYRSPSDPSILRAEYIIVTLDSPTTVFTMGLPAADRESFPHLAYWDRWIARLRTTPPGVSAPTARARNTILHVALISRAVTRGPREINPEFFLYFADELIAIACTARGQSVNHALEHLIADMQCFLPSSIFSNYEYICRPSSEHALDERDCGCAGSAPSRSSRSPSPLETISSNMLVDSDSSYESYDTDSSEEPDSDPEEEERIARGFVVDE
ncbi:hypothetical protein LXA43DRAFT_1064332 [Ganoderma leucocontextum]|nr:hypothetical protein LXA43DRAFT_1064332 [Ganoderma leucocontextum]